LTHFGFQQQRVNNQNQEFQQQKGRIQTQDIEKSNQNPVRNKSYSPEKKREKKNKSTVLGLKI
jgi:hypothetical protein